MGTVINVISGKGGTGKTLLTAVLAELLGYSGKNVLVVDLDIFVRGLTTLLYYHKGETLKIAEKNEMSISDYFADDFDYIHMKQPAITKYRSFEVFPSVHMVNEKLKFNIMPKSFDAANKVIKTILGSIEKNGREYDYIFLDSRAGYDELIAATHINSDISLCVEEDDNISMVTSGNLISQLSNEHKGTVLRIRNKARQMMNNMEGMGYEFVGTIPFDADIMNSFGTTYFWADVNKSLYKDELIKVWNLLSQRMQWNDKLKEDSRVTPVGSKNVERRLAKLPTFKRIIFVYGVLMLFFGTFLYISRIDPHFVYKLMDDPMLAIGVAGIVLGVLLMLFSILSNGRKNS